MKDQVKITVIATGFREIPARRRAAETHTSFAAAHNERMERYPEYEAAPASTPRFEPDDDAAPDMVMMDEHTALAPEPEALPAPSAQISAAEAVSFEDVRPSVVATFDQAPNFEANDLDVPAFLRKGRSEIM